MHHQNEQIMFTRDIAILDVSLVVTECHGGYTARLEPAIISQIWIRENVTKLLLEGMFEIVRTRYRRIVTRASLEVS